MKAAEGKKAKATETAQKMKQFIEDCGLSPNAPAKALARFLTERGVQTPSGRSKTWQATTVRRMKARWGEQRCGLRIDNPCKRVRTLGSKYAYRVPVILRWNKLVALGK